MEGVTDCDPKATRGLEMLAAPSRRKGSKQPGARSGLDLGRRHLVVLKTQEQAAGGGGSSGSKKPEVVRLVDHGETQKEAIRRLFDAEVILRSYEEQIEAQASLLRDYETLLISHGLMPADRDVTKAANKEDKRAKAMGITASLLMAEHADAAQLRRQQKFEEEKQEAGQELNYDERAIPFWLRNDERSRQAIEGVRAHLMRRYADESQLTSAAAVEHLWQCGLDFALRWGGKVGEEVMGQNEEIEERSRQVKREALKETSVLRQHIRNVERRYGELLEEAKKLQRQLKEAQRRPRMVESAVQGPPPESGVLVFPEIPQERAHNMASQIVSQWLGGEQPAAFASEAWPSEGTAASDGAPALSGRGSHAGQAGFGGGSYAAPGHARQAGGGGYGGGGGYSGGGGYGGGGGNGHAGQAAGGGGGYGAGYGHAGNGQPGGGGMAAGRSAVAGRQPAQGRSPRSPSPGGRSPRGPGFLPGANWDASRFEELPQEGQFKSLAQDDSLDFLPEKAELEQMDHEIFEPLNMFDGDMREMMIDVVNEKVRRILTLDPSKYQNGKLPFGLRPDNLNAGQDELVRLRHIIEKLTDELDGVRKERDLLKARLEAMESRMAVHIKGETVVVETPAPPASPPGRGRVSVAETPKSSPPSSPKRPPSREQGVNTEDLERRMQQELERRLREELAKAKQELLDRIAELEAALRAAKAEAGKVEVVEKEVIVERERVVERVVERFSGADAGELEQASKALRQTQDLLRKLLTSLVGLLQRPGSRHQLAVEGLIGRDGSGEAATEKHVQAVAPFEAWTKDVLLHVPELAKPKPPPVVRQVEAAPPPPPPPPEKVIVVEERETEETVRLRQLCKDQEEEIARLLLVVDELRRRLENMGDQAFAEPGGPVAVSMERHGLREIATTRQPQKLRGVFERLYQDACQRITRYSMIRERMLAANNLCGQVLAALGQGRSGAADAVPDFERLNATASAALKGMCYHTDYLFRATCEYAMAQGIENTLFKVQRTPVDYEEAEDTEQPPLPADQEESSRPRGGRLPGRRGDRPRKEKKAAEQVEPTSFGQYVAALREATLEEEWAKANLWRRERSSQQQGKESCTLRAAMEKGKDKDAGKKMAASQSLPALPKGRGFCVESP